MSRTSFLSNGFVAEQARTGAASFTRGLLSFRSCAYWRRQLSMLSSQPIQHRVAGSCGFPEGRGSSCHLGHQKQNRTVSHWNQIRELDINEQESVLLAESSDGPDCSEVENLKSDSQIVPGDFDAGLSAVAAAFTLGIAALLPDILAFATALLGFRMVGTVILSKVFAGDTISKQIDDCDESDNDLSGDGDISSKVPDEATDDFGCTALHVAAHNGVIDQVQQLLTARANVNACEAWGETPLHMAARAGSTEVCEKLIRHGADLDAANADGKTPLVVAAQAGNESTCKLLLDRGAGAHGLADKDLPALLNSILVERLLSA
eukprot:TRINITY_DN6556_c0_g1_i2.p1 TRINITY_DN6556_c0_g1~~TRINITY_DN6556_c0_g1_i2.p1  ORF type:complete len:320 (+),score=69.00 TRINITY_DN6556_c0_g1_i2:60-1019(+)